MTAPAAAEPTPTDPVRRRGAPISSDPVGSPGPWQLRVVVARPGEPAPSAAEVQLTCAPSTPAADVAAALSAQLGLPAGPLVVAGVAVDDAVTVAAAGVVDGCLLGTGASGAPTDGARWQLRVVAGPDAGTVVPLPDGTTELGRGRSPATAPLDGRLTDPTVSRRHARLLVGAGAVTVVDLGSANGTTVDGEDAHAPRRLEPGCLLALGDTRLVLCPAAGSDAAVEPAADGRRDFVRPPRLLAARRPVRVTLPAAPEPREPRRLPLALLLGPLGVGVAVALVLQRPAYLLFAVASPVLMGLHALTDRREVRRERVRLGRAHEEATAAARARVDAACAAETTARRHEAPDAATALLAALLPTSRLWERRVTDADALLLRLGTADLPADVEVVEARPGPDALPEHPVLADVPVTVRLSDVGVLGLAGPAAVLPGLLRRVLLQLGVHHAPRDLGLTLLCADAAAPGTAGASHWATWLPHLRPGGTGPVLVGADPESVAVRVAELTALVAARTAERGRRPDVGFPPHVVVLDGARALRGAPGLAALLEDGPAVGVHAVCAEADEAYLPDTCRATAVLCPDGSRLRVAVAGREPLDDVLPELVPAAAALHAARALASLRDVTPDGDALLPASLRLLDVLGLPAPTADAVRAGWQLGGRSTRAVLGAGVDGPFAVDLVRDGPHALVAGTTGSGKSELLQSLVASLAVGNRPDELHLVLVDYKGGSAFRECAGLPHVVGTVTDLDPHLVERALDSLGAELRRRERLLADAGVKDLDDHVALRRREPHRAPLPRLVLVIDEFASLVRELPDFVTGLVSIAQRGRSLGLHLVLATQRPSGVVSPEVRANTALRIALRVTDAADSHDVVDAPDAAQLPASTPGRAVARLADGALVAFQAGRVGGPRPASAAPGSAPAGPVVRLLGPADLGALQLPEPTAATCSDQPVTDLADLVAAVRDAALAEGIGGQRSPWLPPLPEAVRLSELPGADQQSAPGPPVDHPGDLPALAYGTGDLPAEQARCVPALDLARDGHLLVIGSVGTGRSQVLRALAASAAGCSADDLHLYGLDCGSGALLALRDLPHCGAVVQRVETERAARLLDRLQAEVARRQALLAVAGLADVTEQRRSAAAADRLPRLLLLVDRWEGFTASLGEVEGGRLVDVVLGLLREGASAGVHLVVTGDRSLAAGRLASLVDNRLVLRLADRADYALAGVDPRRVPAHLPPGRGLTTDGVETQVALLGDATTPPTGQAQGAALAALSALTPGAPRSHPPLRVDVLPLRAGLDEALSPRLPVGTALVGVGGDELAPVGLDLAGGRCCVVAGPPRSGRSSVLGVMAESLRRTGTRLLVVAPRPSPLRDLAGRPGVVAVVTDPVLPADGWRALLDSAPPGPVVVVLDDAEVHRDGPAAGLLLDLVRGDLGASLGRELSLVVGGSADALGLGLSGFHVEARASRQGVLLSPQGPSDGDLVGVRLARGLVGRPVAPGRALVHRGDGRLVAVTVPT